MANTPAHFKEADLKRALKVGQTQGLPIAAYEVALDGTIRVFVAGHVTAPTPSKPNSWDD